MHLKLSLSWPDVGEVLSLFFIRKKSLDLLHYEKQISLPCLHSAYTELVLAQGISSIGHASLPFATWRAVSVGKEIGKRVCTTEEGKTESWWVGGFSSRTNRSRIQAAEKKS